MRTIVHSLNTSTTKCYSHANIILRLGSYSPNDFKSEANKERFAECVKPAC